MLICVLSLCCGGVAADVRYDFALLPLYGGRLVTDTHQGGVRQARLPRGELCVAAGARASVRACVVQRRSGVWSAIHAGP